MTTTASVWVLLLISFIAANLPWLNELFLFVIEPKENKTPWMRLLEWLLLYFIIGFISLGFVKKMTGQLHAQEWEFYATGFCLFAVFALPGFIYRYDFLNHWQRWKRRQSK
jgi:succinate dehydrogenase hydrophobic anchor subunit